MSQRSPLRREIDSLNGLDLERLRDEWRRRYGAAPKARSPELVRLALAYRIQAEAFGGLSMRARRKLRSASTAGHDDRLGTGTRIIKTWRGCTYQIDRMEGGFIWDGQRYASLSAVAKAITGVARNGPKFFGLREGAV